MFIVYTPLLLKYRSKKQVKRIERYHVPNEMTFNDEGIQVEFADKKETYEWEQIQKVVTTPKTIGFYYETEKALIVQKPDFGDKYVPILTLATKKLGPARVHLRYPVMWRGKCYRKDGIIYYRK